ncbi:MAG: DNA repair protein RecO [Oscillospiraceae bacterium]
MQITTMGLVIKEVKTGEADRIIHILTQDGVINAIAKGSQRLKSKLFSSTSLFCYAEFTLFNGKSMYIVDEAEVKEVFFGVRQSVEGMALAMYFAELAATLLPQGDEAKALLRLVLNSLSFIAAQKLDFKLLKPLFELRTLTLSGYMPDIVACASCAKYDGGNFYFDVIAGEILCAECAVKRSLTPNIDSATLAALRHIVFSNDEKLFAFTLGKSSINNMYNVVAQYTQCCIDKPMRSLDFLNTVLT